MCYYSYEGTGRSLSLKLIEQLRRQSSVLGVSASSETAATATGEYSDNLDCITFCDP